MKRLKLTLYFCLLIHAHLSVAQTCSPNIIADAPDSRYNVNADGTVVDKKTTLTWMRCALGQNWENSICAGSAQIHLWTSALQAAESAVFAGKNDWRLPNQKELQTLVENRCYDPAINLTAFPNTAGGWTVYWSSSPVAYLSDSAWAVSFYYGSGNWNLKNDYGYVRLVRSEK